MARKTASGFLRRSAQLLAPEESPAGLGASRPQVAPAGPPIDTLYKLPDGARRVHPQFRSAPRGLLTGRHVRRPLPGEIFVRMAQGGSGISASWTRSPRRSRWRCITACRFHVLNRDVSGHRWFRASGFTGNQEIPIATSIMDYRAPLAASVSRRRPSILRRHPAPGRALMTCAKIPLHRRTSARCRPPRPRRSLSVCRPYALPLGVQEPMRRRALMRHADGASRRLPPPHKCRTAARPALS